MKMQNKWIIGLAIAMFVGLASPMPSHGMDQKKLPHIVLYTDINRTIIIESQRKGFDFEKGLAALLSTAPEYAYTWGNDSKKMTYSKWVNEHLFPGSNKDPVLKKKCESYHAGFVEAAQEHGHPMSQAITHEFESLMNSLKAQQSRGVFTSFSNFIKYLREKKYSFSVVLRTFGKDLDWVSQKLAQDGLDPFIYGSFDKGILHLNNQVISNPAYMIAAFKPGKNYAIQDSYDWWKQNNFTEKGGKPFPVDVSDKQILSIFFDDNADDSVRPILNILPVGEKTDLHKLIAMGSVVAVDTRKAILDKNYFIDAFEKALKNWRETTSECQEEK